MAKKITAKEMNEALNRINWGIGIDRNGYILNTILMELRSSAIDMRKYGFNAAAARAEKQADELEAILTDEFNFYEQLI